MNKMQQAAADYKANIETLRENKNRVVRRPIPKLDDDIVPRKNRRGNKKNFTPQRMKNAVNKYFEWCEETDSVPSIKGMMIHMKMYPDAFYRYIKDKLYSDILEQARLIIVNWAEEDVYTTPGMATGKVAYMKNVHTWADKIDTHNVNKTEVTHASVDEARAKIEQLAPMLLDILKSSDTVKQIVDAEVVDGNNGAA